MVSPPQILRTVKNARRLGEILAVLARHGFHDFLQETGLAATLQRGRQLLSRPENEDLAHVPRQVRLRRAMEELGPTFIKVGQILSTRPDLVPPEWAEEFRKLQHDCPQVEYREIRAELERTFGDRLGTLFTAIEETPIAAGSMAQVHRATLASGEGVVLKVLRPGVRDAVQADLEVLAALAEFAEHRLGDLGYSPREVVRELQRELERETDLSAEARSTERLHAFFAGDPRVSFPRVYPATSTREVLTLEEIKGELLSRADYSGLDPEVRRTIVAAGADAVLRQCFELGFFHADPHPGNIFLLEGGRIAFVDCGMVGHLDARTREQIAELVHGTVAGDVDLVIRAVSDLTSMPPLLGQNRAFRADVWEMVSRFQAGSLAGLDVGRLLESFFERLRAHRIQCPADIVFLIKAITTIEGVAEMIAPEFDIVAHITPHMERLVRQRYGLRALRRRLVNTISGYTHLAESLPEQLRALFDQLRRNEFSVSLEHRKLDRLTDALEHASRNISYALVVAALMVCSAILVLAERLRATEPGWLTNVGMGGLVLAALLTIMLAIANFRRRRPD